MPDTTCKAEQYISDVLTGKIIVCEYTRLGVQRHVDDLKKAEDKGWYFDAHAGRRVYGIIGDWFDIFAKATNKTIEIQGWQCFLLYTAFGWKMRDTGYRRFDKMYIEIPRKNGKSLLAACIGLYMSLCDHEYEAEVYCAAMKRDQAMKVFNPAKKIMRKLQKASAAFDDSVEITKLLIENTATDSIFEPLSKDYDHEEGSNPHCGIVDEYHVHPNSGMVDMLESGMVERNQPILLIITTAGFDLSKPCYEYHKSCVRVLKNETENDSTFILIFSIDKGDDWQDPKTWYKSNPNLGSGLKEFAFQKAAQKAISEGIRKEVTFKVKNLNIWLNEAVNWIKSEQWDKNGTDFDLEELRGRRCYVGFDLASLHDLTAVAYIFPPIIEGERVRVLWRFFCPMWKITNPELNEGGINYAQWARDGYIFGTPGKTTDFNFVYDDIVEQSELYEIMHVAYDRHRATQLVSMLTDAGFDCEAVGMTFSYLTMPIEQIENWINNEELDHGNNPVINWMLSNVQVIITGNNYKRIDKAVAKGKIDGIVSLVYATYGYLNNREADNDQSPIMSLV